MQKVKATKTKFTPLTLSLCIILVLYVIFMLAMLFWATLTASKMYAGDYSSFEPDLYPDNILGFPKIFALFDNLSEINNGFSDYTLWSMALNTIAYAVGCSLSKVIVTCVVAYLCARYDKQFSKIVYNVVIITMIVPIVGSQAAEIQMAKELYLYNRIWGMWLMRSNFLGMYYLVFHAMFRALPKDFDEAAYMDGAGNFTIFFRINLPLVVGTFVTVMLIKFIDFWNDYTTPMVYMPSFPTISLGLFNLVSGTKNGTASTQGELAASMIVFIPNFTIFIIFRDKLIGNISMGGLKE